MTAFRRGNRWVAKFVLNGQTHWVKGGPWDRKSHAEAAEARLRDRLTKRVSDETCASFADRWVDEWPRPEEQTNKLYRAAAKRFGDYFGSTRLDEVGRLEARAWGLTVPRHVTRIIGTMYEDIRNVGLVETNPFAALRLPTAKKTPIAPPSMNDYRRLLAGCDVLDGPFADEFRAMIQFSAWTGIRRGELFGLQWQDITDEEIYVVRSRKADGTLGLPKNGQADSMPFLGPARVLDRVERWADCPFVFHTPRGKPYRASTFGWWWELVKKQAGVDCRWHDLRHFCATQLLELGYSHFDVSVQLRHTDNGALVMSRYGHPSKEAAKRRLLTGFDFDSFIGSEIGSREAQNG